MKVMFTMKEKNLEFCVLLWNIFPFGMSGHRNT